MRTVLSSRNVVRALRSTSRRSHPLLHRVGVAHSTIRLTFDRYGHLFPTLDSRLRDGLEAAFRESEAGDPAILDDEEDADDEA